MCNIKEVADTAEMIINGYAFTKDGETKIENKGQLTDREIRIIREFIKDNYKEMYMKWAQKSDNGFYRE